MILLTGEVNRSEVKWCEVNTDEPSGPKRVGRRAPPRADAIPHLEHLGDQTAGEPTRVDPNTTTVVTPAAIADPRSRRPADRVRGGPRTWAVRIAAWPGLRPESHHDRALAEH